MKVILVDFGSRFIMNFKKLKIPVKSLVQFDYHYQYNKKKSLQFYQDLEALFPSQMERQIYFNGENENLPFFLQLPCKFKLIQNLVQTTSRSRWFDMHVND